MLRGGTDGWKEGGGEETLAGTKSLWGVGKKSLTFRLEEDLW